MGPAGVLSLDDGGSGDALPVVFVHSLAGSILHWSRQLEHLRPHRRCVAFDLRGHGKSAPPHDGSFSMEAMGEDVAAVSEQLQLDRFLLVGHSLGSGAAIAYAAVNPGRVAGLLLVDPIGDQRMVPAEEIGSFLDALESDQYAATIETYWEQILKGADETAAKQVMKDLRKTARATVIGGFKSLLDFDPLAALARYRGRILSVITNLNDTPMSLHVLDPGIPVQRVRGTGHWLHMDKPDEFNQILDRFLGYL